MSSSNAPAWRPEVPAGYTGPRIALIHGFLAGSHMQRHLLRFLRDAGYADSTLYSNHRAPSAIARELAPAAAQGRAIVLVGYSQGGFQVMKVARALEQAGVPVALLVSLAAGGVGRWHPAQWRFDPRHLPANVQRCLNAFSLLDRMGSDRSRERNLVRHNGRAELVENICFPAGLGVDHVAIARCYPEARVHRAVREQLLDRVLSELCRVAPDS